MDGDHIINNPQLDDHHHHNQMGTINNSSSSSSSLMLNNNCEIDWDGIFSSSCLSNNNNNNNNLEIMEKRIICGGGSSEDNNNNNNNHPMGDYYCCDNNKLKCGDIIIGEEENNNNKYKGKMVMGKRRNLMAPRIAFQTRSAEDVLDDGYRWRKYGQKAVKHSTHPRSYYRCTHHTCNVKKQIQRHSKDPTIVVTTYEGIHNHPSEKLMETLTPLLKQLQFLSGI